ncbi:hypothetical protein [Actinoplanes sp. URMC 104]|uniref:hypothetical protein n=1 Tax=Actinoplanes sp. URMC 104 TaxID=3423409 RepID=UPI003F1CDCFC
MTMIFVADVAVTLDAVMGDVAALVARLDLPEPLPDLLDTMWSRPGAGPAARRTVAMLAGAGWPVEQLAGFTRREIGDAATVNDAEMAVAILDELLAMAWLPVPAAQA